MVQPPGERFRSGAADGFAAVSTTSGGGHFTATLTSEFDFRRGASCHHGSKMHRF